MIASITIGWWIIPALVTIGAIWWVNSLDYSGDYNFTGVFSVPMAGFVISLSWAIYFALGWALS